MYRTAILTLLIFVASCDSCDKCLAQTSPLERMDDARMRTVDGHDHYNDGKMFALPNGNSKLYTTLILSDDWQNDQRQIQVKKWFETDRRLLDLRSQTFFNIYTLNNPHYRDRMRGCFGNNVPIVAVHQPYEAPPLVLVHKSMPRSSAELADMVYDTLDKRLAPPKFPGLTNETKIVRSDALEDQEGPCPPNQPCPWQPDQPSPGPNTPPMDESYVKPTSPETIFLYVAGGIVIVGGLFVVFCCVLGVGAFALNKKPPKLAAAVAAPAAVRTNMF